MHVRSAAVNYANANTQLRARLEYLSQQYGMQDLSCEDGRKLLPNWTRYLPPERS